MENHRTENQIAGQKQKWYQWVPNWVQVAFALGGLFVTVGIAYANIGGLTQRMDKVEANQMQQANLMVQVGQLHIQIEQANKTQEATNIAVIKLSDSVTQLSNSVSNLQGQLETRKKSRR